jgi:thiosulfate reductase cytochrome b subunit
LRGTVHRAAALIILGALLWHLGHWYSSQPLRRRLRGLRWSLNDLRYLGARWAWYLGLRRTLPPSGPFSYIEKAEYWAFLWGMLIMTASGLVLWFSDFTLRHLPKWFTDVATAVHFYEAVLASLAVAVWHLYWVIFDPDVYPMDRTWWSGQPPASRVREREGDVGNEAQPPDSSAGGPPV